MKSEGLHKTPRFSIRLGFIYPLAYKILETHKIWSPSRWLPHNALATDLYLISCWLIETLIIVVISTTQSLFTFYTCLFVTLFRLLDLMFVLFSILVRGFYKNKDWASAHRITLLVTFNALELMVLFAILYRSLAILAPTISLTNPPIESFFDALYFSVITGTSIGYGIPHPVGWLVKALTMLEGSSIVLVVIAVIGYISNERSKESRNP